MFVKICGITNPEDALAAVRAGARAIGLIFYPPSPRSVTAETAAEWIGQIPSEIWRVGVFVDEKPAEIERVAALLRLDVAQLHGNETPEQHPRGVRIWRAFRVQHIAPPADYPAEAVLLDGPGGGRTFDWNLAAGVNRPVVLSGALTPENVRGAIQFVRPWGVDVASGVEASPGRKNHQRMKQFIEAALEP